MFCVHVHTVTGQWYVTMLNFDHKHEMLDAKRCALLPARRKMTTTDIIKIQNFQKVGIRPSHMYGAFANTSGYENVRVFRKEIYNQVERQR
ncbi:hypothetical protein glysoja_035913 [Glycine soja]|uniref:Protein FAR1-RELATED SEQUENCE n=1 Tax=Glycine soja TaxID=3848 RepID=A0A0B2RIY0_GLYSO|nr:hypothetical protein glysoja_035913 [Glycine soja]